MTQSQNEMGGGGAEAGARQPAFFKASWRRTRMDGVTHPVALRLVSGRLFIQRPLREEYSKSRSHGTWYYSHEVDVIIYLEQSNTGKRGIYVALCRLEPRLCRAVEAAAWSAWVVEGMSTRQVEKRLEGLELAYER